jgi:hypothetical protein
VQLYTVDPLRIERALKNYDGTDIDQVWKSVRKDVDKINELPETSDEVKKYVKSSSLARTMSILLTIVTFVFLLVFLSFTNQIRAIGGPDVVIIAPGAVIAIMYGSLMFNTISTRRLNKAMRNFYNEHEKDLKKQTAHIKDATQLLIDKLQREVYAQDLDPGRFKFELYDDSYKTIKVVGSHRGRIVATVKPKSKSSD